MTTLVPSSMLNQDGGLTSSALAANAVTTAKIADANVTSAKLASGAALANLAAASVGPSLLSQPLTLVTPQASTSGTAITFGSLPSWAKRVTVSLNSVSLSGTALIRFRLGTSGGVVTSGYNGAGSVISAGAATVNQTAGFDLYTNVPNATYVYSGAIQFTEVDATNNIWAAWGVFACHSVAWTHTVGGVLALASVLTQVQVTTSNGTDTFDAGSIGLMYE